MTLHHVTSARLRRRDTRLLLVPLAAAVMLVGGAVAAWAHVEVEAEPGTVGASDVTLTFHVPNEKAPATTTTIALVMPTDHPLPGVSAKPQNGFTPTTTTRHLATPVAGKDGPVSDVVDQVVFKGGALSGTEEKAFALHVDRLPAGVTTLTFKALQTYSDGTVVSWIEVAADGAAEPEHPAPVLTLTDPAASTSSASTKPTSSAPTSSAPTSAAPSATGTAVAATQPTSDGGGFPTALVGWFALAILSAVVTFLVMRRRSLGA